MLEEGERAPQFVAPMATPDAAEGHGEYTSSDVEEFRLQDALRDGPVVLAFFPGVFSSTCTEELCQMRDWLFDLDGLDASVYGVSVDTPWSQLAFIDQYEVNYPLLSGFNNDVIADYDVRREEGLLEGIADRAVYVVAPDGTIAYSWVTYEPLTFPDLDEIREAVERVSD